MNLASASVALLGTFVALIVGSAGKVLPTAVLPVAAGGFLYIAMADLMPELQHDRTLRGLLVQAALVALGIGRMGLLMLTE